MDHRLPRAGLVISLVCAVLALASFLYLNQAFEGPSPTSLISSPYHLEASFRDTEALQTKQPVLVRGYQVGKVTDISYDPASERATVTFTVDTGVVPVYRDATVYVGERTILGDPYLGLDPGTRQAGPAPSGARVAAEPSVNFDQALSFLGRRGRRHLRSALGELGRVARAPGAGGRLSATLYGLARTTAELRDLTAALHDQRGQLGGLVRDSATVVGALASRERALREIVGSGRATLDALASDTRSLARGAAELPRVLSAGTHTLHAARPLLREARPVVRRLARAAPALDPVLSRLPGLAADTVDIVSGMSGLPALRRALELVKRAGPLVPRLEAAARNLVTMLRYTAPRANGIAAFFANMAGAAAHGDSDGHWVRFLISFEPGELNDAPTPTDCSPGATPATGVCHNAYPQPNDALDPKPYAPGSYPRLHAFRPPRGR